MLGAGLGFLGTSLPEFFAMRARASAHASLTRSFGRARSCIVLFSWGGMSHLETWDLKPDAPAEFRGEFRPIATATPGIHIGEHMPLLARQTNRLAIVRSAHHQEAGHRNAAYWNLTGHEPLRPGNDDTILPSRRDWPSLGSMVSRFRHARAGFPGCVALPYPLADRGLLNGQFGGFLGMHHDPFIIRPAAGRPYAGVSPSSEAAELRLPDGMTGQRVRDRLGLAEALASATSPTPGFDHYRQMAANLLLSPGVSAAFNLDREPRHLRDRYGDHVCGQSALMARRLTEAGVPIVTVYASVGDLNGSAGDNWDTHGGNFIRLKDRLLPPLEQASAALLDDLAERGRLDETLVVWLTEFGRTPRINGGAGRDHYPDCYSVAFAGGGIRGGQIYGRSDRIGAKPADRPCGPQDLHATIFHALGIPLDSQVTDALGRHMGLTDGSPLPLFG
ncbi:MAG: DUF1501 domain-containing protein [Planctomycetes bacterium]|nr:DUF1501 domain-containing protein [Planctomycetota bacterium]